MSLLYFPEGGLDFGRGGEMSKLVKAASRSLADIVGRFLFFSESDSNGCNGPKGNYQLP